MTFRDTSELTRIQIARSDIVVSPVVYDAATRIFTTYMAADKVNKENLDDMLTKSVQLAIELALTTDRSLKVTEDRQSF
ncbi:MAG: hypothetical protein BMS9Abin15_0356 [Gammaproteobacteria bacterium]|nr:MAG: hypothetical protein BMS9Abin15_0356 [Gammaproteobacteria bacterium]